MLLEIGTTIYNTQNVNLAYYLVLMTFSFLRIKNSQNVKELFQYIN